MRAVVSSANSLALPLRLSFYFPVLLKYFNFQIKVAANLRAD